MILQKGPFKFAGTMTGIKFGADGGVSIRVDLDGKTGQGTADVTLDRDEARRLLKALGAPDSPVFGS